MSAPTCPSPGASACVLHQLKYTRRDSLSLFNSRFNMRDEVGRGYSTSSTPFITPSRADVPSSTKQAPWVLSAEWLNLSCIGGIGTLPGWPWLVRSATPDAVCSSPPEHCTLLYHARTPSRSHTRARRFTDSLSSFFFFLPFFSPSTTTQWLFLSSVFAPISYVIVVSTNRCAPKHYNRNRANRIRALMHQNNFYVYFW